MSGAMLFLLGILAGLALAAAGSIGLAVSVLSPAWPPAERRQPEQGRHPCG